MHQTAVHLRRCCQPSLRWNFCKVHVLPLSSASTVPAVDINEQAIGTLEPWQISDVKALAKHEKDAKDIIVDDLSATLEAHRASNRAAVIRKVDVDTLELAAPFKRPLLDQDGDGGSEVQETQKEKLKMIRQLWPADSVQAKSIYGNTGSKGYVKRNDPLEYHGVVQWLKQRWRISNTYKGAQMQRPWLAYIGNTSEDAPERLTNEIKAYEAYMRLSPREEAASELVISDVNSVARNEPKIQELTLLGSRSTGLATPVSDFDFTVTLPISLPGGWIIPPSGESLSQVQSLNYDNKCEALRALTKIERHFRSSEKFGNIEFVRYARVPIIRSKHVATGLNVQIQTMAPYQAAQQYTIAYLSEFPSLRPLYIILRYCLELRNLTTVFEGGLGSYSILMMIVTAIKHSSGKFAPEDLGGQLLHVLDFYSKADLYNVGFSADPPRTFEKRKKRWPVEERAARMADPQLSGIDQMPTFYPRKPYLLCLQDPANVLNDLGKNAYAIKHIQATFLNAKESLQKALEGKNQTSGDKAKGMIWSYLDQLVWADYRAFEWHRCRVEQVASTRRQEDGDYSEQQIRGEFMKRLNRYKGIAEEHDDLSEPVTEAIERNAAESVQAEHSLSDGTRLADGITTWSRKERSRIRNRTRRQAKERAIATRKEKIEKLQGNNDDEYGWGPSSPNDQETLLEATAVLESASAATTSALEPVAQSQIRNQDMDEQTAEMPTPDVSSTIGQQPKSGVPLQVDLKRQEVSSPPLTAANPPNSRTLPLRKIDGKDKSLLAGLQETQRHNEQLNSSRTRDIDKPQKAHKKRGNITNTKIRRHLTLGRKNPSTNNAARTRATEKYIEANGASAGTKPNNVIKKRGKKDRIRKHVSASLPWMMPPLHKRDAVSEGDYAEVGV